MRRGVGAVYLLLSGSHVTLPLQLVLPFVPNTKVVDDVDLCCLRRRVSHEKGDRIEKLRTGYLPLDPLRPHLFDMFLESAFCRSRVRVVLHDT